MFLDFHICTLLFFSLFFKCFNELLFSPFNLITYIVYSGNGRKL